ncbi:MAG: DUF4399 domain-containing protein [Candidatus Sedimenticola sp. (ex Thyasira tokunagai)]
MNKAIKLLTAVTLMFSSITISLAHSPPKEARIFFIGLQDGAVVQSPVHVKFGIQSFGITPAGTKGKIRHKAGHHHLLLNAPSLPDMDEAIPRDKQHLHFDQGETETVLELPSGKHTLQLLLGDEEHEPQDPPLYSDKITIIVK